MECTPFLREWLETGAVVIATIIVVVAFIKEPMIKRIKARRLRRWYANMIKEGKPLVESIKV